MRSTKSDTPGMRVSWLSRCPLAVGLRGLLSYSAPTVLPSLPSVSQQSCGRGPVNGY